MFLCPVRCLSVPFVASPFRSFRFHNGSKFRDSVPLRHGFHRRVLSAGLLNGIAPPSRSHNGSRFRDSVPLRHGFHRRVLSAGLLNGIAPPSRFHNGSTVSTTAADSAIRCRCGMAFFAVSFLQAFCAALSFRPVPTTAANSAIRCRCGIAFRLAPCHRLSHHTPYPSSTFRRCAVFPRFRLTFRRCVESPHLRERPVSVFLQPPCVSHLPKVRRIPTFSSHLPKVCSFKMKRPDVLCRKTYIAFTRILVFLPLLNRK